MASTFTTTQGNWDLYIPFVEQAISLTVSHGQSALIVPNKWVSIGYGEALREMLEDQLVLLSDFSRVNVFDDAGIFPVVVLSSKTKSGSEIEIESYGKSYLSRFSQSISRDFLRKLPHFGALLSEEAPLLRKLLEDNRRIANIADVEEPFTVSEAYEIEEYVQEIADEDSFKLVTTGAIDRYEFLWGVELVRYLGTSYSKPAVSSKALSSEFPRRYEQTAQPKIIISGIRNFEACIDREGKFLAAKSTVIVENPIDNIDLDTILAVLNSKLMWFYIKNVYSSLAMDEGINFTAPLVRQLPSPDFAPSEVDLHLAENNVDFSDLSSNSEKIKKLTDDMADLHSQRHYLNLSLPDYLGNYESGPTLGEFYQPPAGLADSILTDTAAERANLRVGTVTVAEEGPKLVLRATAR